MIAIAFIKVTIDSTDSKLKKKYNKKAEVNVCLPMQRCMENNSVNSVEVCLKRGHSRVSSFIYK